MLFSDKSTDKSNNLYGSYLSTAPVSAAQARIQGFSFWAAPSLADSSLADSSLAYSSLSDSSLADSSLADCRASGLYPA